MSTVQFARNFAHKETHEVFEKASRPAIPIKSGAQVHALHTVPGSLKHFLTLSAAPYSDTYSIVANRDPTEARAAESLPYNLPLWSSKFGGFGYLPKSMPYPINRATKTPLQMIAQINFAELQAQWRLYGKKDAEAHMLPSPLWPTKGVLAFYIDPFDDLFGSKFSPTESQEGYRVLYFDSEIDSEVMPLLKRHADGALTLEQLESELSAVMWTREDQYELFEEAYKSGNENVTSMYSGGCHNDRSKEEEAALEELRKVLWMVPFKTFDSPHLSSASRAPNLPRLWYTALCYTERSMYVAEPAAAPIDMVPIYCTDYRWQILRPLREQFPSRFADYGSVWTNEDAVCDSNPVEQLCSGNLIGGYPYFTQEDPRPDPEEGADGDSIDMLLFQPSSTEDMMWGDAGVANFFISPSDLRERRFDRAWFNWDCC